MIHRSPFIRLVVVLMCVAVPLSAFAASGRGRGFGSSIEFTAPDTPHESVQLIVALPNGEMISREYSSGRPITLRVSDLGTDAPDGQYNYEVRATPRLSADVKKKLASARAANDDAAARKIMRDAGLEPVTYSGTFTIARGAIVDTELTEGDAGETSSIRSEDKSVTGPATPRGGKITVNDQVIPDDLIVQGSTCVGFDCVNNESFGFDTIRLKENNTRIKFEDTSTGSFPTNDWQLTANDSASGGASKFSVEDITGAKVPLTITAGAATNSVFVDSTGRVGFRTSTPVLDLHVSTSNTPAIRLEQTSAGGFTAQTWDIAGNEANFFVRDVTGGSRLPFRIRPGAPTSSVDISATGNVGIGLASPNSKLDVISGTRSGTHSTGRAIYVTGEFGQVSTGAEFGHNNATSGVGIGWGGLYMFGSVADLNMALMPKGSGNLGIGVATPTFQIHHSSGARLDAGVWTNASSRDFKDQVKALDVNEAMATLEKLEPVTFVYKSKPGDPHVGFIAEDVPALVATPDRKALASMDVVAVLTRVVQEQQKTIEDLKCRLDAMAEQK